MRDFPDAGGDQDAHALGRALGGWLDELDQLLLADGPRPAWAREDAPVFGQPDIEGLPVVDERSIAAGVYSAGGDLTYGTAAFLEGACDALVDRERLAAVAAGEGPSWVSLEDNEGETAGAGLIVYARGAQTVTWRLPAEVHEIAHTHQTSVVVLTTTLDPRSAPLRDACLAYGLTGLQTRVALETIRTGAIKAAAANLGVSYQTSREALAGAMERLDVSRLPALVTRLTTLAFGVFPGRAISADVLADVWGLTERQTAIAGLLAQGLSREQTAQLLGIGVAVVKKELDTAYSLMQVGSSAGLARRLVEARALSCLTATTAGGVGFVEPQSEPLRFALRQDGRRVAFSDYGPASGKPVLILHSSMTTRIVSRKLLRALHKAGYRPIAIDRPGFGLTDPLTRADGASDPFSTATPDVACVLTKLKISRADIVSRGAAQFLVALATAAPDCIGQVVLVNPGPPYRDSGRGIGPLAVVKAAFVRNPATIRALAPFLAGQLTFHRLSRMVAQWTRGSPPDELAAQDPEFIADFFRSVRMFATGRYEGFLREQAAISRGGSPPPFAGAAGWRVLLGASDVLYEPRVVLDYWRERLPGAAFSIVRDGGRFLAMTHADLVVEALQDI